MGWSNELAYRSKQDTPKAPKFLEQYCLGQLQHIVELATTSHQILGYQTRVLSHLLPPNTLQRIVD